MKINAAETAELLRGIDKPVLIVMHASPDGDTAGSGYALARILALLGKDVSCVCSDELPPSFGVLEQLRREFGGFGSELGAGVGTDTDSEEVVVDTGGKYVISVDIADAKLSGIYKNIRFDLSIDHHATNTLYADNVFLDDGAAAAEAVYSLFEIFAAAGEVVFDSLIKTAVYLGISTDTGCFRYGNTTARTHAVAAAVMEGLDFSDLNYTLFEVKTRGQIALTRYALSHMEFLYEGRCAIVALDNAILSEVGVDTDTDSISSLTRQIDGVFAGVLMKEKKAGVWKFSVRTAASVNAAEICRRLNGGGHRQAAGGRLCGTYDEAYAAVTAAVGAVLGGN